MELLNDLWETILGCAPKEGRILAQALASACSQEIPGPSYLEVSANVSARNRDRLARLLAVINEPDYSTGAQGVILEAVCETFPGLRGKDRVHKIWGGDWVRDAGGLRVQPVVGCSCAGFHAALNVRWLTQEPAISGWSAAMPTQGEAEAEALEMLRFNQELKGG